MERRSTILLVEESSDDVLFFQHALRDGGQDHFGRGEEAMDYLQRACQRGEVSGYPAPKFLIMDNRLLGLDGAGLLLWMSENSSDTVVPMVDLSGADRPRDVKLAFELGVHGYFVQPASNRELTDLLKMIFRYGGLQRAAREAIRAH